MNPYIPPQLPTDGSTTPTSSSSDRNQHPKYRGVRKRKWGKWVSEIRLPNCRERIWLGSYDTPEKAARAFDAAQYCLRGRNAQFNFPDTLPDISVDPCLSQREIQAVAARFANEHEHEHEHGGGGSSAAPTNFAERAPSVVGAGSSECVNMDWPFVDNWYNDDRIYGGMHYMSSEMHSPDHHRANAPAEDDEIDEDEHVEDGDLHHPSFLWNF